MASTLPRAVGCVLAVLVTAASVGPAAGQVKPKIYIIFDTSGSMTASGNDGSPLCGNNGQNSRVYQLKVALFDVLQGVGATEVDFALATFPMFVDGMRTPKCGDSCTDGPAPNQCAGHYYVTQAQSNETHPGREGCKVSTHDPSTQRTGNCGTATCAWYNDFKAEVLKVPFGNAPENVMIYFDQQEDAGQVAILQNPEIRARSSWYTPLGKSLFYAHGYFHKEAVLPANDYRKKCERLVVAMFTDGQETCNDNSHGDPNFFPVDWASNLNQNLGVVVHTVAIDINSGQIQQIATAGGGDYYQVAGNANALKIAFQEIIAKSLPPGETCNDEDDDCDNLIDEDFPLKGTPCDNGKQGACFRTGVYVCAANGNGVVCNAPNASGTAEICDGIDNNCNGEVDEGLNCPICVVQPEVCNGVDDDCNGVPDDNIPQVVCGTAVGVCRAGVTKCENGKSTCDGGVGPSPEVCDGLDNDCDGQRDGFVEPCYSFNTGCDPQTGICKGQCRLGIKQCNAVQSGGNWQGVWTGCTGDKGPEEDVCDGIDNNCDGQVDEQAECPGGSQCVEGRCTSSCATGEFVCPVGQLCKDGWCVLDPCDPQACAAKGWVCQGGECVDACSNVTCGKFEACKLGRCVDDSCYQARPCASGERCIQGKCVVDPCAAVAATCGGDEFCLDGQCTKLCDRTACSAGQSCQVVDEGGRKTTRCVADLCAGVVCAANQVCIGGSCQVDPCEFMGCPSGQICLKGDCIDDPCETVSCPQRYRCELGRCVSQATGTTEALATGSGGFSCAVGGGGASGAWWLVMFGLVALRRRRGRCG